MAITPDQQYLTDTKQADSPEQCCMTLGGYVEIDDEGTPMCVIMNQQSSAVADGSFYLSEACGYAESIAEDEDSAGNQNGGGFGNWLSGNLGNLTQGFADVWGALNPPPPDTTTNITNIQQEQAEKDKKTKQLLVIGGVVLFIVLGVYLIKKSKN